MRLTKEEAYKALEDTIEYCRTHKDHLSVEQNGHEIRQARNSNWLVGELENTANANRDVYHFGPNERRNAQVVWLLSRRLIVRGTSSKKFFEITEKGKQVLEWCIMHDIMPFWDEPRLTGVVK